MMISRIELAGQGDIGPAVDAIRGRSPVTPSAVAEVQRIIDAVRDRGDEAAFEYTRRYDGISIAAADLEVPEVERKAAFDNLDEETREAIRKVEGRISSFALESLQPDWARRETPGLNVGLVHRPLERVGIYLPGGRYSYPSTALMTGVLAREAGVPDIIFCVPPGEGGSVDSVTLAAAAVVGKCRLFKLGGAQAIAAMAYGTDTVPRCEMIAGPGNMYVTIAKRLVSDLVTIDLEAGPSEVAIYVDGSSDIYYACADALAQWEHDPMAIAVILSQSGDLLDSAAASLSELAEGLEEENATGGSISLVRCPSRQTAIDFLNALAPEHLELMVENTADTLDQIRSAGCVFMGEYSAAALGDYIAGPSHVLPTGGTATRLSGLKADDFRRTMGVISYTKEGFDADAPQAGLLARLEGLRGHSMSLDIRMRGKAGR